MAAYYWIKLWLDLLSDPKMGPLRDRLWRRAIELFLVARTGDGDGYLPALDVVAWQLHLSVEELETDLQDLHVLTGIVEYHDGRWFVTNFAKRQAPVTAKERMKRMRERNGYEHLNSDAGVTTRNLEAEAEAEEQKTEEQKVEAEADQSKTAADYASVSTLLRMAGVEEPALTNLAGSAWVTVAYVNGWWAYISSWKTADLDTKIKSLIVRLQERRQVPPDWREKA